MSWRFRKSFSPLPGIRLTLGPAGITTSVGVGAFRITNGPRGTALTARVPGTGISYRQPLHDDSPDRPPTPSSPSGGNSEPPRGHDQSIGAREIRSAAAESLTSPSLREFKNLLSEARLEHMKIMGELTEAKQKETREVGRYERWQNGFLLRRLFKEKFRHLALAAEECSARRAELEEQERLSHLQTEIAVPASVATAFGALCTEFMQLAQSRRIWDTTSHRSNDRARERTLADTTVTRKPVTFRMGKVDAIDIDHPGPFPVLENANGGTLYLYPAFILYFENADRFALLEYGDVSLQPKTTRFIESESVPADAEVVGQTWAKCNKDGSRDRRFAGNYEIPIVRYGEFTLKSPGGLEECYTFSNVVKTDSFVRAWASFVDTTRASPASGG
jgi:hypothetical protein